ncbi:MAG: acido-empty-quinoprotein group A [Acidobacteria bacterium]|nr:acido-empty-quinoprotein group A [Acidobacteriota bacterium]
MTLKKLVLTLSFAAAPVLILGQGAPAGQASGAQGGLDPKEIYKRLSDQWLTYSGDYTGQRYSALTQVNQQTVKNLTLAWTARITGGAPGGAAGGGFGGFGGGGGAQAPVVVGGEGTGEFAAGGGVTVKGSIIVHDDVMYVTAPDNTWAMDVRDGRVLWRYYWKTRGGTHIGQRGAGLWHDYLYFTTPDNYLVSVDARTGKERWHVEVSDFEEQYFTTFAPHVIDNHVIVGTGNDLDMPGFLQSFDPETGKLQWKFYTVPMSAGDPGLDTWPNLDAARHGGGQVWIPGSFDPETRYYIFGTGNPTPGYTGQGRPGDNLFTGCLMAVHVDTGKMIWYFQTSAHDTHDWDSAQTPVLWDGVIDGKPRKLASTVARNGYFYTVDRVTGQHLVTQKLGTYTNWAKEMRPTGVMEPNPAKEATIPGSLVSPVEGGVVNWPPPAYSPDTGLLYSQEKNGFNLLYLTEPDPRGSMGLGGKAVGQVGSAGDFLVGLDPKTGKVAWRHAFPGGGGGGLLVTAGRVLFSGDGSGNFVAFDATNGKPIWHSRIGNPSNAAQTYLVDGKQHVLVAVGDTLYAFAMY